MKTGLVMVISAITLFTGTVVWSAFKLVPRRVHRFDVKALMTPARPDSATAQAYFFHSGKTSLINIDGPFSVELDDHFSGIELVGDTSLFKYLWVATDQNPGSMESIRVGVIQLNSNSNEATRDSSSEQKATDDFIRQETLRNANIRVRVGIGSSHLQGPRYRYFTFSHCKKVSTPRMIRSEDLQLNIFQTDSVELHLEVNQLALLFPNFSTENTASVHLEGKSNRVNINNFAGGALDATRLQAKDLYMENIKEADIRVYASEVARIQQVENCKIQVEGNPPYQWIEGRE